MGIPYSKQINAAFNQVTPLVASGYELLETVKNIAIFITIIQIGIITLLLLNLIALLGLLFTLNPDLAIERRRLVTPAMKWIAGCMMAAAEKKWLLFGTTVGSFAILGFAYITYVYHARKSAEEIAEESFERDDGLEEKEDSIQGEEGDEPEEANS